MLLTTVIIINILILLLVIITAKKSHTGLAMCINNNDAQEKSNILLNFNS